MFGKKKEKAEDQLQMVKLCNVASFVDAERAAGILEL